MTADLFCSLQLLKQLFRHENIEVIVHPGMPLQVTESAFVTIRDLWNRAMIFLRNGSDICQMSQTIILVGIETCTVRVHWIVVSNDIWLHNDFR